MDAFEAWRKAYAYATEHLPDAAFEYWRNLPHPSQVDDRWFMAEATWIILNSGFKESLLRKKWPLFQDILWDFDVDLILSDPETCVASALAVINYPRKIRAIISAAEIVRRDRPMGPKLGSMSPEEALAYFETFPFIGPITCFHLARNVGFDVVKPDRHLVRLAAAVGASTPAELVEPIHVATGERRGFIDYVFWYWLSNMTPEEYAATIGARSSF